jgi:hypothetical protein
MKTQLFSKENHIDVKKNELLAFSDCFKKKKNKILTASLAID